MFIVLFAHLSKIIFHLKQQFEFRPDQTIDFGVTGPLVKKKQKKKKTYAILS